MTDTQGRTRADVPDPTRARTRDELVAAIGAGAEPKWLMFWGHQPSAGGIGKEVLSQWWPCRFSFDGIDYTSAEHYMMASKARLFDDSATLAKILASPTPAEAKNFGRLVQGFDDATWNAARFEIVVAASVLKFGQDASLQDYLLGTANRILVEASPRDRIWGIGLSSGHPDATDPRRWRGENLLGFALAEARDRLARSGGGIGADTTRDS